MSDLLLLLLGPSTDAPLRWGAFDGARLLEGGWIDNAEALSDLPESAKGARRVAALLPGEQVASRPMTTAPKGAVRLRAAAAYLMEDELGENADALRIAVATDRAPPVAIAARNEIIGNWLSALAQAGLECDVLSADYLALPLNGETALVVADGERVIAAFNGTGASIELDLFAELAPQLFGAQKRVALIGDPGLAKLLPGETDFLGEADDARILSIFADAVRASAPANFVQAKLFNRKALETVIAPWRRVGMLAAALAGLLFLSVIVDGVRAERIANRWEAAAERLHRQYFPEEENVDPVAFARGRLNEGGGSSFLFLSSKFAEALAANDEIEIDRIRYNAARGEFVVSIRSRSDAAIEALKTTLAEAGVTAQDSGGYRNIGGVWTGELSARAR